jgi:hypothetical protein
MRHIVPMLTATSRTPGERPRPIHRVAPTERRGRGRGARTQAVHGAAHSTQGDYKHHKSACWCFKTTRPWARRMVPRLPTWRGGFNSTPVAPLARRERAHPAVTARSLIAGKSLNLSASASSFIFSHLTCAKVPPERPEGPGSRWDFTRLCVSGSAWVDRQTHPHSLRACRRGRKPHYSPQHPFSL